MPVRLEMIISACDLPSGQGYAQLEAFGRKITAVILKKLIPECTKMHMMLDWVDASAVRCSVGTMLDTASFLKVFDQAQQDRCATQV